jgi:hypothetical protein
MLSKCGTIEINEIIGSFFPSISDRLKNTLQLQNDLAHQEGNIELLRASVNQRSSELSIIPFKNAIKINENKRYLTYLIPKPEHLDKPVNILVI